MSKEDRGCNMKKQGRRQLIIITICVAIVICFLCFYIGYQNYKEPKLGEFEVLNLTEQTEGFYLNATPSHHAVTYEVEIKNGSGEEIFTTESNSNNILLKNFTTNYGDKLKIKVIAKNKNGTEREANKIYEYTWQNPSFNNPNGRHIDVAKGLSLLLSGYEQNSIYTVRLEYLNQVIYEEQIATNNIFIPYQRLEGYAGRITAKLYTEKNSLISSYNFYVNTPVIGKVKISRPETELKTRWNDIDFEFEGGKNASEFHLNIVEEGMLVNQIVLPADTKRYTLPAEYLNENKNYYFELVATYLDYEEISEKDGISAFIGEKEKTNPVYTSHSPSFMKKGSKITLASRTSDAAIYYTLDGTEPTTNSLVYKEPITINENTLIKTKAISKRRWDSDTNTYDFQIGEKNLIVYLSPSNQSWNYGNTEAGFRTEMLEMNEIGDVVERVLKENGVTVYRNNRNNKDINTYISESNYRKVDFHLAIHSNASLDREAQGIEIYVDKQTSKALSIATNIYQNLYQIYPYKNGVSTDRGVKFADGALGEVNDSFLPCGTLIEIAYHDNYDDARWILENKEKIGKNIAQSILLFYN